MDKTEFKKKAIANTIIILLFITISINLFQNIHNSNKHLQNAEMVADKSYEEQYLYRHPLMYKIFNFIRDNVEKNSIVVIFNRSYFQYGQPYLIPDVVLKFFGYSNNVTEKEELLDYLDENNVDYIIIIESEFDLYDPIYFTRIEDLTSEIYLLEVDKSKL